jgi:hypothetical protein
MATQQISLWDEVDEFLASSPSLEQILAFRPAENVQKRIAYLLETNGEGQLTSEEAGELDQYFAIDVLVSRLKVKAIAKLKQ